MSPPLTYLHWQRQARSLLEPLAALMRPGRADLAIAGLASDHDPQADRLESFARPLLLAAFYLQSAVSSPATADETAFRDKIAGWFRAGLVAGSNPASPHYWGPDASYHQHHVEMGLMTIALQLASRDLWTPLAATEKASVAGWFATCRGGGIVNNNHLFMSVHILEFLGEAGFAHRTDRAVIVAHLNQLETMHRGGGWFEDGINQAYDHYNAYAFHFYGLWWARLHGAGDPARGDRWRNWAQLFVRDYQHFFAASGEHPAFGRSICYRFNAINVFGLALAENCTDLPPGRLRRLCTRNLDFFLSRPITQEQGCLNAGFTDRFDQIVEPYSCAASPYWAAKGFTPLLLPPEHPFWHVPEEPLPAERGFVHVMPVPGLITRSVRGEVEILNAGSMVSNTQTRYGPWKWSKLSYRTGTHFTYAFPEASTYSLDSALTAQVDDGRIFGRHSTVATELTANHLGYAYNLGFKTGQVNTGVETYIFWHGGWLLHVHLVEPRQPVVLTLGGFALPLAEPAMSPANLGGIEGRDERPRSSGSAFGVAPHSRPGGPPSVVLAKEGDAQPYLCFTAPDDRTTALQALTPNLQPGWDNRLDESTPRRHVAALFHVTPIVRTRRLAAPLTLAALSYVGPVADAAPWQILSAPAGHWELTHPTLGAWQISHWSLPALA